MDETSQEPLDDQRLPHSPHPLVWKVPPGFFDQPLEEVADVEREDDEPAQQIPPSPDGAPYFATTVLMLVAANPGASGTPDDDFLDEHDMNESLWRESVKWHRSEGLMRRNGGKLYVTPKGDEWLATLQEAAEVDADFEEQLERGREAISSALRHNSSRKHALLRALLEDGKWHYVNDLVAVGDRLGISYMALYKAYRETPGCARKRDGTRGPMMWCMVDIPRRRDEPVNVPLSDD